MGRNKNYIVKTEISTILVLCVLILIFYFFPFFDKKYRSYEKEMPARIQLINLPPATQQTNVKEMIPLKPVLHAENDREDILDSMKIVKNAIIDSFFFSYADLYLPWKDVSRFDPSKLNKEDSSNTLLTVYKQYLREKSWLKNVCQYDFRGNPYYIPGDVAEKNMHYMSRETNVLLVKMNISEAVKSFPGFFNKNTKLSLDHILEIQDDIYLLAIFWEHDHVTLKELYQDERVYKKNSYHSLKESVNVLKTAGLIQVSYLKGDEKYYTATYTRYNLVGIINKFIVAIKERNQYQYDELNKILNQIILSN